MIPPTADKVQRAIYVCTSCAHIDRISLSDKTMAPNKPNPYQHTGSANAMAVRAATSKRWPLMICVCAVAFYIASAVSLPFVNRLWIGEAPLLAIIQLPKLFFKSVVHQLLMHMVNVFGWSSGSFSADYGATHGWAMGIMVAFPPLAIIVLLYCIRSLPNRFRLTSALAICATIDGAITLWFDATSNLKLYNAQFF